MRSLNSPPASPTFTPDRPAIEHDALVPDHFAETPTATDLDSDLDTPMNHYDWPVHTPQSVAHADHPSDAYHAIEDGDEDEGEGEDGDEDEDEDADAGEDGADYGDNGAGILDLEEGGAPLNDANMDSSGEDQHGTPQLLAQDPDEPAFADPDIPLQPLAAPTNPITLQPIQVLQQLQDLQDLQDAEDAGLQAAHIMALSNPNPVSLGPENPSVLQFLQLWRWHSREDAQLRNAGRIPCSRAIDRMARESPRRVEYNQLNGNDYDFQGINWTALGITRSAARDRRMATFVNYVNKPNSDTWNESQPDRLLRPVENFFRYQSMDIRRDVRLLHFQLRNILGCTSRSRAFYPSENAIKEHDPTTGRTKTAMHFDNPSDAHVSTMTAGEDVVIAGGFYGGYRYRSLDSEDIECADGRLTENISGITNHVQIHSSRLSSVPVAAFCSNDYGFRVVDLATNRLISETMYDFALNCSALSPDKRLRVVVGDNQNILITDAEKGDILQSLEGHRDYGFSCDWAPDGWTVATGNQDKSIRIWDARKWKNSNGQAISIAVIRNEIAGARSLRFSPLGSGKRVLVAAEEADYINVIDAQTFNTRQTIDIFGELGGISFANGGHELIALSCDAFRGGILRLERCDAGMEDNFSYAPRKYPEPRGWWRTPGYDWAQSPEQVVEKPDSQETLSQKRRKAAMLEDWIF
ncbi:WD40-repeat-containing domain protein [Whalleya microplaca]|nr:WD40-repeat-containing domain protein [Whalleya microplaca]